MTPYRFSRPRSLPKRASWLRIAWAVLTRGLRAKLYRRALAERWWRMSEVERSRLLEHGSPRDAILAISFVTRETAELLRVARNRSLDMAFEAWGRSEELGGVPFVRVPDGRTRKVRM